MNRTELQNAEKSIHEQIRKMGDDAVQALRDTATAMDKQDVKFANAISENDAGFNQRYLQIQNECITTIARHQPVATDLREMVSDLQIAMELERIADHIASMAQFASRINDEGIPPVWGEVFNMIKRTGEMMEKMLKAYDDMDTDAVAVICTGDDDIDRLNEQIVREIMNFMSANNSAINNGTHLIWLVHNIERICDRITNIGEQILFVRTGKLVDLNAP